MRRYDGWGCKVRSRKGQGTGRMRFMKSLARRSRNHFREVSNYTRGSTSKLNLSTRPKTLVRAKVPLRRLL